MVTQIFVNLPVKDLKKSMEFWKALGFSFNPQFTDDKGAALMLNEAKGIFVMLLAEPFFKTFIAQKGIADAMKEVEVINAIAVETREQVDEMMNKALEMGATKYRDPMDYGWMYNLAFQDIDGHLWEVLYIDTTKAPKTPQE